MKIQILFLLFTWFSYGQEFTFLESKYGFKNIKLGTSVALYPEFILKNDSNKTLFKWSGNSKTSHVYVGKESDKIKTAKILFIYLVTENDSITEIEVVTEKVLNVYSILKNAYGNPSSGVGSKWIWRAESIECSIEGEGSEIPGYHVVYKMISNERRKLNELKSKNKKEAQAEL